MSFAFGFADDDSDTEAVPQPSYVLDDSVLDVEPESEIFAAKPVKLVELLATLVGVRLTYSQLHDRPVFKRELFDIRHQAMTEDNDDTNSMLLDGSDLKKNQYEGGFKIWECSVDLVDQMIRDGPCRYKRVVEIGCGAALPSCYLFRQKIAENNSEPLTLVLSDYNIDVLRLVTVPNLLINWHTARTSEPELHVTQEVVDAFVGDLSALNISLEFISGAWGRRFLELVGPANLVLTSETIYSLDTMPVLAQMVLTLGFQGCKSLIGAKNFYFGVGGSVVEFLRYLQNNKQGLVVDTHEINSQLKRSIITVHT